MEIKKFGFYFLFIIILLIAAKFYSIVYGFIPSIAAACVLTYIFNPAYLLLTRRIGHPKLSAFIVIAVIVFLILIPFTLIFIAVQQQMEMLFNENTIIKMRATLESIDQFVQNRFNIELYDTIINNYFNEIFPRFISGAQKAITFLGPKMLVSITWFVLSTFVAIFIMYYLLLNSQKVIKIFREYFPISFSNSAILLDEMGKYTKALIYGQLLIALIQGSLGALGFFIFGIGGALFWGLIMVVASFIPVFGAALVWFPAAIVLLARNQLISAAGLVIWGALVVGTVDNLIRPKLTEKLGKIHPVTVLLGVLIGIKEWGFIGIVIGPLIISVLIILIKMFREEYLVE